MLLQYSDLAIFLDGFHYELGGTRRSLEELDAEGLLGGSIEHLAATGYRYNFGLSEEETLVSLATKSIARTLEQEPETRALVFQHCNAESAVLPCDIDDKVGASRNRYFPAAALRQLQLDGIPYLGSFASGCAGFLSLLIAAAGLFNGTDERPVICVLADNRPPGTPFDLPRERILGTDHSSSFVVNRCRRGYQILGVNFYSTTRLLVPLVEIVKRTVQMIDDLAKNLGLSLAASETVIHYPNIFPDTWQMVTRYLRLPQIEPVLDAMAERAHCGASDSVISLSKLHRNREGRLHIVVNYGVGLHLGVCILKEHNADEAGT